MMFPLAKRLGLMADAMVSAVVGPKSRFFSRERVDEVVLLLREAEKALIDVGARERAQRLRADALAPPEPPDVERWRTFYQALAWMVNDYIGVCGISTDFTQKHQALGYAHEGFHNAERVRREHKPPVPDGMRQGIRCKCWKTDKTAPHHHYDEPPYRCARGCGCKAYEPAAPPRADAQPEPRRVEKAHGHEEVQ